MNMAQANKIVIEGITETGETFRPSDWAERVCGSYSTFKNHRIHYSPLLYPTVIEGHWSIILDPDLQDNAPALFDYILKFAEDNNLRISNQPPLQ